VGPPQKAGGSVGRRININYLPFTLHPLSFILILILIVSVFFTRVERSMF
jgi:hypothetical protein